jgi:pyruvate ferredoxin oxidoreductase delta subunit
MTLSIGAVVKGASALDYATGSWRSQKPVLNPGLCTFCGFCEEVCPDGVVDIDSREIFIDMNYCKGCGLCAYECPTHAIDMVREEK